MSRWIELYATSPSGKTMWVCKMCGRHSVVPDRECPELPVAGPHKFAMRCSLLEEMEEAVLELDGKAPPIDCFLYVAVDHSGIGHVQWKVKGVRGSAPLVIDFNTTAKNEFPRTPDGYINNCALANFDEEKNCQICKGTCPDRKRFP